MNLTFSYIEGELREKYPQSRQITADGVGEILDLFMRKGWGVEQFDVAMLTYRREDESYRFPPDFRQLACYVPQSSTQRPGVSHDRMSRLFVNVVINHGWTEAVRCGLDSQLGGDASQCLALQEWLASRNITAESPDYFGLNDWLKQFFILLHHDRNPASAYEFAIYNGPPKSRMFYQSGYDFLSALPIEKARRYFPVLR